MKKIYATLLLTLSILSCHAQITQVDNMKEVFRYFEGADSKTLAIFDVDMVLVHPSDPAFQMANMKRYGQVFKSIIKSLPFEKQTVLFCLTTISSEPVLVDECIPQLLRKLQDKGIPTMALTANLTGSLGAIPNMQQWRYTSLCALGIDFAKSAPFADALTFEDQIPFRSNHPEYMNGVFCVNGDNITKGDAFLSFVKKTGVSPEKIIFIDDRLHNLQSVESAIRKLGRQIEYRGLHFTGADNYPSKMISKEEFEATWRKLAKEALELN